MARFLLGGIFTKTPKISNVSRETKSTIFMVGFVLQFNIF